MNPPSDILVIEPNFVERANILQTFKKHQLTHKIAFLNNIKEALIEVYYFNKDQTSDYFPQIIMLSPGKTSVEFLSKIREEERYNDIKIFLLIEKESKINKENYSYLGISGFVERPFDFKNFSNKSYLDTLNLFVELLRTQAIAQRNAYIDK